jgi:integrase
VGSEGNNLITVAEAAVRLHVSRDYVYKRLDTGHQQFISHKRLPGCGDIRFDPKVIDGYLQPIEGEGKVVETGSAVREGIKMTRNRDRGGTLLVRGRKRKFWRVQWPEGKKRPVHMLGYCDQMTESQAKRAKRQYMEKINRQRDIAGDPTTLDGFWKQHYWNEEQQQYGDELATKRPSTRRDMKSTMHKVWLARFGTRKMDSLKTGEIQRFLADLIGPREEGKVSRQTALKFKTYFSSVFSAAIRLECGVTHNPVRAVKVTAEEPEKPRTHLTPEQAVAIEQKLTDPRHRMAWRFNLWAGNRCGEIRGLRWRNVFWDSATILVTESVWEGNSTPPKTKKGYRKVVLTPKQMAELKKYRDENHPDAAPDAWVFPGKRNRPLDMGWLMSEHIKPIAGELGIRGVHWHALRHLNNALMMNEGVDVATRMDRLGHVTDRVNLIYGHVGDQAQRAASEAIERKLEAAREELEKKQQAGCQTQSPPLSVTQTVTQNEGAKPSH